jgi:hypothetical protein
MYPAPSQFGTTLSDTNADAVVLSIPVKPLPDWFGTIAMASCSTRLRRRDGQVAIEIG